MSALPEIWKNRDEYSIEDAARLWAHVQGEYPLNGDQRERNKFSRELELARKDLITAVPVQRVMSEAPPAPRRLSSGWVNAWREPRPGWELDGPRDNPGPVVKTERQFFRGIDLAAFAVQRGKPGLFGFDDSPAPVMADNEAPTNKAVLMTPNGKRELTDMEGTLYQIIRALALALAETDPDNLKKGPKTWEGYATPSGSKGITGHLKEGGFTELSGETLRKHIKKAIDGD